MPIDVGDERRQRIGDPLEAQPVQLARLLQPERLGDVVPLSWVSLGRADK